MSEARPLFTHAVERGAETARALLAVIDGRGTIAGSFAAWMGTPEDSAAVAPGDIDIFAHSAEVAPQLARDLANKVGLGIAEVGPGGKVWHIPRNSPDLSLQVITPSPKWKDFPDDILNSFDLDVCRAALVYRSEAKYLLADTYFSLTEQTVPEVFYVRGDGSLGNVEATILRVDNPVRQLRHIMKYVSRGITFSDWQLLKLFRAWDDLKSRDRVGKILVAYAEETASYADDDMGGDWRDDFDDDFDDEDDDDDWFEGE